MITRFQFISDFGFQISRVAARRLRPCFRLFLFKAVFLLGLNAAAAEATNTLGTNTLNLSTPAMPDIGGSLLRVMGSLALVLAIFLGGVWLFRNWQRLTLQRGGAPKLNVTEVRSLGGRHALYVVGYEHERFLLSASPTGVNLLSRLQSVEPGATPEPVPTPGSFAEALKDKLKGK